MKMNKRRVQTKRSGIGIYVDGGSPKLKEAVTQLLRLTTVDAPSDVRIEAIKSVMAISSRPITISSNIIRMSDK